MVVFLWWPGNSSWWLVLNGFSCFSTARKWCGSFWSFRLEPCCHLLYWGSHPDNKKKKKKQIPSHMVQYGKVVGESPIQYPQFLCGICLCTESSMDQSYKGSRRVLIRTVMDPDTRTPPLRVISWDVCLFTHWTGSGLGMLGSGYIWGDMGDNGCSSPWGQTVNDDIKRFFLLEWFGKLFIDVHIYRSTDGRL